MLNIFVAVLVYVLAVLSAAAGVPKILQMPQELALLGSIGLPSVGVSTLGVLQVAGGVLMLWGKSRLPGTLVVIVGFLISTVAIFASGNTSFGLMSLIPVAAALIIAGRLLSARGRGDA